MPLKAPVCVATAVAAVLASATALSCWQCGEYSDGVGSITPCLNTSTLHLIACAHNYRYCIKYVSELSTVRDCVPSCSERESWGARTHCCHSDGCNAGGRTPGASGAALLACACSLLAPALLAY